MSRCMSVPFLRTEKRPNCIVHQHLLSGTVILSPIAPLSTPVKLPVAVRQVSVTDCNQSTVTLADLAQNLLQN